RGRVDAQDARDSRQEEPVDGAPDRPWRHPPLRPDPRHREAALDSGQLRLLQVRGVAVRDPSARSRARLRRGLALRRPPGAPAPQEGRLALLVAPNPVRAPASDAACRRRRSATVVEDGLDVVAVGIEQEGAVVAAVVLRTLAGLAVRAVAGLD